MMTKISKIVFVVLFILKCVSIQPVVANKSHPTLFDEDSINFPNNLTLANGTNDENKKDVDIVVNIIESSNPESIKVQKPADAGTHGSQEDSTDHGGIHLASWKWDEFSNLLAFLVMIISAAILKLLFHHCHCLSHLFPESCVLIVIGVVVGAVVKYGIAETHHHHFPTFTSELFFHFLLPPIILDASYAIYDPEFLSTLASILIFAVAGTLFNVFTIGFGLYIVCYIGAMGQFPETMFEKFQEPNVTSLSDHLTTPFMATQAPNLTTNAMFNEQVGHTHATLTAVECLTFSSLISAVDPVAVLAIFEDIGVNRGLYFLVFGESLLNDGVTVVLYNSMVSLGNLPSATGMDYLMVFFSFFTVVFGGLMIGIIFGLLTSYIVKFTKETRVIEPLIVLALAYLSYILAETIHWSGIISLIGCGVVQKRYAFLNISRKSNTTVKYSIKTLASISDCMIFLFLGIVTVSGLNHQWHTGFTLWTCFFCLIFRFSSVYFLSAIINRYRVKPISLQEQFIMSYGGLRGAVGFSLAQILSDDNPFKEMFLTATIFMVFFTVFIQGGTIKFLVDKLKIKKHEEGAKLISDDVNMKCFDHVMAGVASVVGEFSKLMIKEKMRKWDETHLKKWLIKEDAIDLMTLKWEEISIDEHYARLYGPRILVHEHKINAMIGADASEDSSEDTNVLMRVPSIRPQPSTTSNSETSSHIERMRLKQAFSSSPYERYKSKSYRNQDSEDQILEEIKTRKAARTKAIWATALAKAKEEAVTQNGNSSDQENDAMTSGDKRPKSLFTFSEAADKLLETNKKEPTLKRGVSHYGEGMRLRQVYRNAFLQPVKETEEKRSHDVIVTENETQQENATNLDDVSNATSKYDEKDR